MKPPNSYVNIKDSKLSLLSSPLVASGANVVTQTDWITTLSTDVEIGVMSR